MHSNVLRQVSPAIPASGSACSTQSCDRSKGVLAELPNGIREKVRNHPCFSEDAHRYYARMHLAVAPSCNIQCHYCNRKYDCANESRPGVVSELLSPQQAVKKVLAVAAKVPQMTVVGIAGPGDPLANPERTLATFDQLSRSAPDLKLCVSTNGLALPELVDELCKYNIEHMTITINCTDPEIGAKIYPWVFWNNRRIKGVKGVEILIEQQQKGLEMLVERGVLVKINSVMIPGVNDKHLEQVSKIVKEKGAFLHNVMPLIAEPEHGTFYGQTGQRVPSHEEIKSLQDSCAGDMNMMRHCRQCRADAVGMIGEDRQDEFTLEKIEALEIDYTKAIAERRQVHAAIEASRQAKQEGSNQIRIPLSQIRRSAKPDVSRPVIMAVATHGGGLIDQHFDRVSTFSVYEVTATDVRLIGKRNVELDCSGEITRHGSASSHKTIAALSGCEAVLCSAIGYESWLLLEQAGILPNGEHASAEIEEAALAVYREMADQGLLKARTGLESRRSA